MSGSYAEALKDPRWQRLRLWVMERDEWTCQVCADTSTELHVHHIKYGKTPWDVHPHEDLVTMCATCHRAYHANREGCWDVARTLADQYGIASVDILRLVMAYVSHTPQQRADWLGSAEGSGEPVYLTKGLEYLRDRMETDNEGGEA